MGLRVRMRAVCSCVRVCVSLFFECTTETAFILHRYVQENNNDKHKALAGSLASAASSAAIAQR